MKQARIVLSSIESTDLPQVFLGFSSPQVTRYYGLSYTTLDDCREQMNWYEQIICDESGRWLAIRSVLDGRFMGAIGYTIIIQPLAVRNLVTGYCLIFGGKD